MNLVFWTWCSGLLSDFIASLLACEETELRAWVSKVAFCSCGVFYKHDPTSHQPPTLPPTTGSVIRHPAMGLQCSGSTSAKGSVQRRCQQRSGWEWGGTVGTFKRVPARSRFLLCLPTNAPFPLKVVFYFILLCFPLASNPRSSVYSQASLLSICRGQRETK